VRPLRFSINITLDGCCDHRAVIPTEAMHHHAADIFVRNDASIFGRVTYEMMEAAWRNPGPEMPAWTKPFSDAISGSKKYVVSTTLTEVDWNSELIRGDLGTAVRKLKEQPGKGIAVGGTKLALALAELGLIDEYQFVVHPRIAGHKPTIFAGLSKLIDLKPIDRVELGDGIVATRYEPFKR
jgi:dihydrofolate reductase